MIFPYRSKHGQLFVTTLADSLRKGLSPAPRITTRDFPKELKDNPNPKRLGIINGMSTACGDNLVGQAALSLWSDLHPDCQITLYQFDGWKLRDINRQYGFAIKELPCTLEELNNNDAYLSFGGVAARTAFQTLNLFDFYLSELGIVDVDPELKTPTYIPNGNRLLDHPSILLHSKATAPIRSCPMPFVEKILEAIYDTATIYLTVNAAELESMRKFSKGKGNIIPIHPERVEDLSQYIAGVDLVVSVDSLPIHLAGAMGVPTIGLFTTIEPDLRTRYYHKCRSIMLGQPGDEHYGKHQSFDDPSYLWERLDLDLLKTMVDVELIWTDRDRENLK